MSKLSCTTHSRQPRVARFSSFMPQWEQNRTPEFAQDYHGSAASHGRFHLFFAGARS